MFKESLVIITNPKQKSKHPNCKGYEYWTDFGYEYDCGYGSDLTCEDCKYGLGKCDPEAKCNQSK